MRKTKLSDQVRNPINQCIFSITKSIFFKHSHEQTFVVITTAQHLGFKHVRFNLILKKALAGKIIYNMLTTFSLKLRSGTWMWTTTGLAKTLSVTHVK
jgi:hypothetical protein